MGTLTVQEHSLYYTHLCLSHFISIIKHSHLLNLVFLYSLFVRTLRGWVISCLVDILADPNGRGTMIVYASNAKFSHFFPTIVFIFDFCFVLLCFFILCPKNTLFVTKVCNSFCSVNLFSILYILPDYTGIKIQTLHL